ncbi:MAG: GspE/PulE family protein [Candidatus Thiodiazotropha sp.]|nr:GspE/PulE family protein [Candidatus Thiodiazotropha sp.]MCM8884698.1 GspE/PulE family protein [Candidatus Thiodiazotropha sp.]MCM8921710.1 GspE/PulE family protein [Candidatus Thiodiazotropha sp.]
MLNKQSDDRQLELGELLEWLVEDGLIDAELGRTVKAVTKGSKHKQHPLVLIADHKWPNQLNQQSILDIKPLTEWLADRVGIPLLHIDPLKVNVPAITSVMSYAYAKRFNIIAVEVKYNEVIIATAEPFLREWERELSRILGKTITRVMVDPVEIERYLVEFYSLSHSVRAAHDDSQDIGPSSVQNLEQLMELGRSGQLEANDQHVVNIVDWLLQYAYSQRASDIHIEPSRDQTNIRFRIDGVMQMVYQIPPSVGTPVTSRIKILGRMDVSEKRRPQDGRLKTRNKQGHEVELRLSTMPTAFGEKLVMRIFDPEVLLKDYRALGFSQVETGLWGDLIGRPNGIILVTGPTGSGKTTTLYTTLKELARPEVNVCTVEDPIELVEPSFNQMQVQHNIGLNFASGVRTLLRQDPDIIMIGEIRDRETAEMAVQASLTGHLVFSTLHTNDAPTAITRLLEIGVPPYLLKATLLGVLGQRLTRILCPHCKEKVPLNMELWETMITPLRAKQRPKTVYQPIGCLECRQTGFLGRVGIYEMMIISTGIKRLITADCDINQLRRQAINEGMRPLRLSGAQKVASGISTIEEVLKVAPPESIEI